MSGIERCDATTWRDDVAARLAAGDRFAGAWVSRRDGTRRWHAAFAGPSERLMTLICPAPAGAVPTIVDLVPAAAWDEREAHDLYGLRFDGHEPLRALAAHPEEPAAWTTPVEGVGVHDVAVGPVHAGIIESGHFRFHAVGERILALDPRLYYKHRGLERAAEGHPVDGAIAYAQRACAACAVTNTVAYAQAAEEARGLWPDHHTRIARTVLLELERLYNHLNDISAICAGVGFAPGTMAFAALKDRAQRLNRRLAGHRFLFGAISVAGSHLTLDQAATNAARQELHDLRADAATAWRTLEFAAPLQARLDDVGVLHASRRDAARSHGPGRSCQRHRHRPKNGEPTPRIRELPPGNAPPARRRRCRPARPARSRTASHLGHPRRPAHRAAGPGTCTRTTDPRPLGLSSVESPRGATLAAVEIDRSGIVRFHLRTGSYANWPALAHATAGNLLPDFPLINKSFELCYACVDR